MEFSTIIGLVIALLGIAIFATGIYDKQGGSLFIGTIVCMFGITTWLSWKLAFTIAFAFSVNVALWF